MSYKPELAEQILNVLKNSKELMRSSEIGRELGLISETPEFGVMRDAIHQMVDEGILRRHTRRRYGIEKPKQRPLQGILKYSNQQFFVETDSSETPRVFIKHQHILTAFPGDQVEVTILSSHRDKKPKGQIVRIIERSDEPIPGTLDYDGDFYYLVPEQTDRYYVDFLVHYQKIGGAKKGDKVLAKLIRWENPHKSPEAEIIEVRAKTEESRNEFDVIVKEFNLPTQFPAIVEEQAEAVAIDVPESEIARRLDLREVDIVTIDPDDARDFDDALSLDILENGNYKLGVHIADVSHYIREGTALDDEALKRATSVYLVDRVVPMLPHVLSSNICSLMPDVERLAFTVFMEFTPKGILKDHSIHESVIRSHRRFTYAEAQDVIDSGEGDYSELILKLYELAEILRKKRYTTGGIDFETYEIKFVLDENKTPLKAVVKRRTDATGLVEECMLAANQTVAGHIKNLSKKLKLGKNLLPFLYRVHDKPDAEKVQNALTFIRSLGLKIELNDLSSKEINQLLQQTANLPEKPMIHQVLLRSQAKAVYSYYNIGHYGLGFSDYSHFTSPIRRYPDLIAHRFLKEYGAGKVSQARLAKMQEFVEFADDHCSAMERLAVEAERASIKLAQAQMAQQYVGQEFNGTVAGVTNFGLFVSVDDIYVEGLLHMRDLGDDYYNFDEKRFRLIGRRTKNIYRIGSRLRIQIVNVNVKRRQIDFRYVGAALEAPVLKDEDIVVNVEAPQESLQNDSFKNESVTQIAKKATRKKTGFTDAEKPKTSRTKALKTEAPQPAVEKPKPARSKVLKAEAPAEKPKSTRKKVLKTETPAIEIPAIKKGGRKKKGE
ncbi:MAG: ribonuclease R [Bacteroidota bacterium]